MEKYKNHFDELDGLRIFFALSVVLHHYWVFIGGRQIDNCPKISEFVYVYGFLSVEFFFILSGFLMEHTYAKIIDSLSFSQFIGRRLKTLYVPYLCAECLGILFQFFYYYVLYQGKIIILSDFKITVANIIRSFSMTMFGWNVEAPTFPTFMLPTWYINVLILCYVLYFAVLRLARCLNIKHIYIYIVVMLFTWSFFQMDIRFPFLLPNSSRGYWCFFVGCILYHIQKSGVFNKKCYILVLDSVVLFFLIIGHKFDIANIFGDVELVFVFLIFPVLILTVENLLIVKKIFSLKILTLVSKYSVDIYFTHIFVIWSVQLLNVYFCWNLNFASYKVFSGVLLIVFVFAFFWHWFMSIVTPALNRLFMNFISPAMIQK